MIRSVSNLRRFIVGAVVAGALLVAAPTAAFASTHHTVTHKPGSSCTKAEVGKTLKSGKSKLVCTAVEVYRWEKKK